jgi:hypothetical protein
MANIGSYGATRIYSYKYVLGKSFVRGDDRVMMRGETYRHTISNRNSGDRLSVDSQRSAPSRQGPRSISEGYEIM